MRSGAASGVGRHSRPTFWRMKLMPIAVISGASLGAVRSGRYATRSIIVLSVPLHSIAMANPRMMPPTVGISPAAGATPGGGGPAERAPDRDRQDGADHEALAVGEVDQLDDAVDERVAERDERPDRPVGQPRLDVLQCLLRIRREVVEERRAEQHPQDVVVEDRERRAPGAEALRLL